MQWIAEGKVDPTLGKALEFDGRSNAYLHFDGCGTRLRGQDRAMYISVGSYDPEHLHDPDRSHTMLHTLVGHRIRVTVETVEAPQPKTELGERQPGSMRILSEEKVDRALAIRSEVWAHDASILIQEQRAEIGRLVSELDQARHGSFIR